MRAVSCTRVTAAGLSMPVSCSLPPSLVSVNCRSGRRERSTSRARSRCSAVAKVATTDWPERSMAPTSAFWSRSALRTSATSES
ncbi:Uncharacterised protein [Bordetella pertussis]|nr:Uncharacterised protein [Bordetella pertussis]